MALSLGFDYGLGNLLAVLGLVGSLGVPVGLPPAPEEPLMYNVAPDECLFYMTWAGTAEPDPQSTNQVEQLLAEPEIQQFLTDAEKMIRTGLGRAATREGQETEQFVHEVIGWAKTLLTHPTAAFLSDVTMSPTGPDIRGGAVVHLDDKLAAAKAWLLKYQTVFLAGAVEQVDIAGTTWYRLKLDPSAPAITWGTKGKCLIVGIGEGSIEGILKRASTAVPKWLADLREQLPVERTSTVAYVNAKSLIAQFAPLGGPEVNDLLTAVGLANVTSLGGVTGLDGEGFVSRTLIAMDGPPEGLLATLLKQRLRPADLAPISSDATMAVAFRADADALLDSLLTALGQVEPSGVRELSGALDMLKQQTGIDFRADVLNSVGDSWCVSYEGRLGYAGLTATVPVRDRDRLAAVQSKIVTLVETAAEQAAEVGMASDADDTQADPPIDGAELDEFDEDMVIEESDFFGQIRPPSIEQVKHAGQDIYVYDSGEMFSFFAPSWCLTEDELIVSMMPQGVKGYLSRGAEFKPLSDDPQVISAFEPGREPVALMYTNTRDVFDMVYSSLLMYAQFGRSGLAEWGIDLKMSMLPSPQSIRRHLRPGLVQLRRTEAGIELFSRQSVPGGNLVMTLPVAAGFVITDMRVGREMEPRMSSMNNLKQIGLTMHVYNEAHGTLPPAYSADADGKPLLSWRVRVLPYIEEQSLYEKFHLDEPWDSEHNKKLIEQMPDVFRAPGSKAGAGKTVYLTVRGEKTAFPGSKGVRLAEIADGTSHTIAAVEVADEKAVTWTKPDDLQYDPKKPIAGLVGQGRNGFNVLFCDGSVHFIADSVNSDVLRNLFQRNDGQVIPTDAIP